jgi:hypothetical protein
MKSFCFFFQKEALSFFEKRNKKLLSIGGVFCQVPRALSLARRADAPRLLASRRLTLWAPGLTPRMAVVAICFDIVTFMAC